MSTPVMYRGASIYAAEDPFATAMLVDDGQIAWMGTETAASTLLSSDMRCVDLDGALITPAFVDSHVHLTQLGEFLTGLDLSTATSAASVLDAVAAHVAQAPGQPVVGHGWDETTWNDQTLPTPDQLQRASGNVDVYLSRIDVHTGLVSASLAARAGLGVDGSVPWLPDETEHPLVRSLVMDRTGDTYARMQAHALEHLARHGHAAAVEMAAPYIGGGEDLEALLSVPDEVAAATPAVYAYWGQLVQTEAEAEAAIGSFRRSRHRRVVGLGGDLCADGSLGSHSAALRAPYVDVPGTGELLLDAATIGAHVEACTAAGVQAAFHAIGDAAVDNVLAGTARAAQSLGERQVHRLGHRIEHAEGLDAAGIQEMLRLGMTASVQPQFDSLWGGTDQLYAQRLGAERALALNPFGSLSAAGVPLALGSDAPVTTPDAWAAIAACMNHHTVSERIPARAAFLAHTRAGYRAVREPDPLAGTLRWGAPATFAVWEPSELEVASPDSGSASFSTDARARTPMLPALDSPAPRCLSTVRNGVVLHEELGL
ncbi:MAG: amidohydrolase [Galactobacter sp.]